VFKGSVIGRSQLELWARGLAKFTADRARYDSAQFFDVDYDDFVADPLGTVSAVYSYFGLTLSDSTRDAMGALHTSGDRRRSHRYSLADFGLTADQVDSRFLVSS
jgi:hypothetical protein